ncbi:hypothetical protein CRENBAI_003430 [Crenichthys baileyi]|uniref:Uncharacterized protein n=1 Tax=Crenichthys baileyi TaxID=28760 RepID=A0AAV9RE27_9TELE
MGIRDEGWRRGDKKRERGKKFRFVTNRSAGHFSDHAAWLPPPHYWTHRNRAAHHTKVCVKDMEAEKEEGVSWGILCLFT